MAPRSNALLVFAAVAARALGQAPACSDVSGLYGVSNNEVTLTQRGCVITGTDLFTQGITGNVSGNNVTINIAQPDGINMTYMGVYDGIGMINLNMGMFYLRKLNCSKGWAGLWTSPGGASLLIAVNLSTCTGVLYSTSVVNGTQGTPVFLSPTMAIFAGYNGANATAVMTGPERLTLLGANYTMTGTNPCFSDNDFNPNPMCFRDILNLAAPNGTYTVYGSYMAMKNQRWSNVHTYECNSGSTTQSKCPASCNWRTDSSSSQGWCSCPDQSTCLAAGFAWVSAGYWSCQPGMVDQLFTATQDCCGGKSSFCSYIGQIPSYNYGPTPMPMPMPSYTGGMCKQLPSRQIQDLEAATGMVVRRCGAAPPTPMPSPYYSPSPYYYSPSPFYMPSPSYSMAPTPSPTFASPTPSSRR